MIGTDGAMESYTLGFKSLLYPQPAVEWSLSFLNSKMGDRKMVLINLFAGQE